MNSKFKKNLEFTGNCYAHADRVRRGSSPYDAYRDEMEQQTYNLVEDSFSVVEKEGDEVNFYEIREIGRRKAERGMVLVTLIWGRGEGIWLWFCTSEDKKS